MHQIVDVKSRIFRIGLYLIESESINYFGTLFLSNVKYKEETVSGVPVSAEASISALVFPSFIIEARTSICLRLI